MLINFYKEKIRPHLLSIIIVLIIFTVVGYLFARGNSEKIAEFIKEMFTDKNIIDEMGRIDGFKLFLNNLRVAIMSVLLGFIPFLALPYLIMAVNGAVIGGVFGAGATLSGGLPIWKIIVFGILPHGIFELPALFLAAAIGIRLSRMVGQAIMKKEGREPVRPFIKDALKFFTLVILPMLVIAAIIETTITPLLLNLAM